VNCNISAGNAKDVCFQEVVRPMPDHVTNIQDDVSKEIFQRSSIQHDQVQEIQPMASGGEGSQETSFNLIPKQQRLRIQERTTNPDILSKDSSMSSRNIITVQAEIHNPPNEIIELNKFQSNSRRSFEDIVNDARHVEDLQLIEEDLVEDNFDLGKVTARDDHYEYNFGSDDLFIHDAGSVFPSSDCNSGQDSLKDIECQESVEQQDISQEIDVMNLSEAVQERPRIEDQLLVDQKYLYKESPPRRTSRISTGIKPRELIDYECYMIQHQPEPRSIKQVYKSSEKDQWIQAMSKEIIKHGDW
jgi:hypothetical protein